MRVPTVIRLVSPPAYHPRHAIIRRVVVLDNGDTQMQRWVDARGVRVHTLDPYRNPHTDVTADQGRRCA